VSIAGLAFFHAPGQNAAENAERVRVGAWPASMNTYTLGIDFGTNSVRALVVACADGAEIAAGVRPYPSGQDGILLDPRDHNLARQHPADYLRCLEEAVTAALVAARGDSGFSAERVIGVGVDTTGSTPIPVDGQNRALAEHAGWGEHLAAMAWLWKDHTSIAEAAEITDLARSMRPQYLAKCGGAYSSEWYWSKVLHCLRTAPEVFDAAADWIECADWIPAQLAGVETPSAVKRGVCAAGHKALYSEEWQGWPDEEFLARLDPRLAALRRRLPQKAYDGAYLAGALAPRWASRLGLPAGIPIAIGALDAHLGAVGAGVAEGVLVKIIGTSSCDCTVAPMDRRLADIPGICGIVPGSILPGYYGLEAGQSAVGDIFRWFVEEVCRGDAGLHGALTREAAGLRPGQSGLLALDWNNGNRNVLADPRLTGLLLGQTLHTTQAEIYRALIEATAFGARKINERFREYGVPLRRIVCCGGIAEKNPLLMRIYADVTNCTMQLARSAQSCALGSAIAAAVAAGRAKGGYDTFAEAQGAMCGVKAEEFAPRQENVAVYDDLYALYTALHDAFGGVNRATDLADLMKRLLAIKAAQSA
jgi:L-ribulokinase